ncbi:MAG: family 43 glycosylhydrolase [Weeksellaceae bacterium]
MNLREQLYQHEIEKIEHFGEVQLFNHNFPDPCFCEGFVFATDDHDRKVKIQVAQLTPQGWQLESRDALAYLPKGVKENSVCWAPAVTPYYLDTYGGDKTYRGYACFDTGQGMGIYSLWTDDLHKPFIPKNLVCSGLEYEFIDPSVETTYTVDENGHILDREMTMYFGSMKNKPVKKLRLTGDGFQAATDIQEVTRPDNELYEAPEIVSINGRDELVVSAGSTWGTDTYFILNPGYIQNDTFYPHEKNTVLNGRHTNEHGQWMNPGHQEIVKYGDRYFMFYHRSKIDDPNFRAPFVCEVLPTTNGFKV